MNTHEFGQSVDFRFCVNSQLSPHSVREAITYGAEFDPNNLASVTAYINTPGVVLPLDLDNKKVACVDPRESALIIPLGRRSNVDRKPSFLSAIRRPGGDLGYVMAVMSADPEISPEQAVELVYGWTVSQGRSFGMHEGIHAVHHKVDNQIGCGHTDLSSLSQNEELYGLDSGKVIAAKKYITEKLNSNWELPIPMDIPMLKGDHHENVVFEVNSSNKTINPVGGGLIGFRYDAVQDGTLLVELCRFLNNRGTNIDHERLRLANDQQTGATLKLLAAGRPVYKIDLFGPMPVVDYKGNVL